MGGGSSRNLRGAFDRAHHVGAAGGIEAFLLFIDEFGAQLGGENLGCFDLRSHLGIVPEKRLDLCALGRIEFSQAICGEFRVVSLHKAWRAGIGKSSCG